MEKKPEPKLPLRKRIVLFILDSAPVAWLRTKHRWLVKLQSNARRLIKTKAIPAVRNMTRRLWFLARYRATPAILKSAWLAFNGCLLAIVIAMTYKGYQRPIDPTYKDVLVAMTGTIGTVIALFFTLVLIPFNLITAKYSPKFLGNLRSDSLFAIAFLYAISALTYDAIFLTRGASSPIAWAAVILFIYLFVIIAILWRHTIYLSDPEYSILKPEREKTVRTIKKLIRYYKKQQRRQLARLPNSSGRERSILDNFKPNDAVIQYIKNSLLPIREIAVKAIVAHELELAQRAIGSMAYIINGYLQARREFTNDDDPLMYFAYTEFKLLASQTGPTLNLQLYPFLVKCWRDIGVCATMVNVKGLPRVPNNTNGLVTYPVKALEELFIQNCQNADSNAPGDACRALGDIGVSLMEQGYDHQASLIVQKLATLSKICETADLGIYTAMANYALIRIYCAGLQYRNVCYRDGYNYAFGLIHEAIEPVMTQVMRKKRTTFESGMIAPLTGWLTDPFTSLNLGRATEIALFSAELEEWAVEMNMKSVEWNTEQIIRAITLFEANQDHFFAEQSYETLYANVLTLLSYINGAMAKSHVFFYSTEPVKSDRLIGSAQALIKTTFQSLIQNAMTGTISHMPGRSPLDILLSLYLIIFYEFKLQHHDELAAVFEDTHLQLVSMLNARTNNGQTNGNSEICKYFRLARTILWHKRFYQLAKDFNVPPYTYGTHGFDILPESEYPEIMGRRNWFLTRPTFQTDGYYYNDAEIALGIRSD